MITALRSLSLLSAILLGNVHAADQSLCDDSDSLTERCDFTADSLAAARAGYSRECSLPRRDCDPVANGDWMCASYQIGSNAPPLHPTVASSECSSPTAAPSAETPVVSPASDSEAQTPDPEAPQTPDPGTQEPNSAEAACEFTADTLAAARRGYRENCSAPRRDCDPTPDGRWTCSSEVIGASAPGAAAGSGASPENTAATIDPQPDWKDSYSAGEQCYCDSNFDHNIGSVLVDTPEGPQTVRQVCERIGSGPGAAGHPIYNDVQCGHGPANSSEQESLCPGRIDQGPAGCQRLGPHWNLARYYGAQAESPAPAMPPAEESPPAGETPPTGTGRPYALPAGSHYRAGDLIALHYDHAPDRDDAQAAAAGLTVSRHFALAPHVVSGTYGAANASRYQPAAEAVMYAVWGQEGVRGNWWNANADYTRARNESATRWIEALDSGGRVWVAEGGQSDFTADVIREIKRRSSLIDTRRIHVVQHNLSFNEAKTSSDDLAYMKGTASYVTIDDGNAKNGTPDLRQRNPVFTQSALASEEADAWRAAFDYLPPDCAPQNGQCKLDFSDAVELLWILGIDSETFSDTAGFAEYFFR